MIKNIKISRLHLMLLPLFGLSIMFFGCEGPEGPPGADGVDGLAGLDINETCKVCHDSGEAIVARRAQYAVSVHATGGHAGAENRTDCAACHTSQGFLEVLTTGQDTVVAAFANPNQPNCRTCHDLHNTYTIDDWARRATDAFTARTGETIDIGEGNLCGRCHQLRPSFPVPAITVGTAAADSVTVSTYSGAHNASQSNMLNGSGAWEVVPTTGPVAYTNSLHTSAVTNGCPTCHMADARGTEAGGHTMKMYYESRGSEALYTEGCKTCHTDASTLTALVDAADESVDGLLEGLILALFDRGVLQTDSTTTPVSQKISGEEWGALFNLKMVEKDHSHGIHNTNYTEAILKNTIAKVAEMAASGH